MVRISVSLALGLVLCAPAPVRANEAAIYAVQFLGEYFAGRTLDALWNSGSTSPEERVKELDARLSVYEAGLRQVDAKMAEQVAQLRKDLSTKTTAEQVRAIVKETLGELDGRIQKLEASAGRLENRQDKIDQRVKQIEELFGHIPTVPPSPLLRSSVESGKPMAHPLTLEWLALLTRSEQSRLKLEELRRTRAETSKAVLEAAARDKEILVESAKLHARVKEELARRLADRQDLLREYKPSAPEVRKFDDEMASVTWLTAVTRPIPVGAHAGRLGVPPSLFGHDASEMMLAFKLAKADLGQVAELYRHQLLADAARDPFLGVQLHGERLSAPMKEVGSEVLELALKAFDLGHRVQALDGRLKAALKDYSAESMQVKELRKEQAACMAAVRELDQQFAEQLMKACRKYLEAMELERPTNERMTAFREGVLLPAAAWSETLRSTEEGIDPQTWQRLCALRLSPRTYKVPARKGDSILGFCPASMTIVYGNAEDLATLRIWDATSGQDRCTLKGPLGTGFTPAPFSLDGKTLASGIGHSTIILWDTAAGRELCKLTGHKEIIRCLAFSPDGKTLASGSYDRTLKLWSVATGQELHSIKAHAQPPGTVAFSPDGKTLASTDGTTTKLWNVATGREGRSLDCDRDSDTHRLYFTPDGKTLVAAIGWQLMMWDVMTGKKVRTIFRGSDNSYKSVGISPDSKTVAFTSYDTLKLWDVPTGELLTVTGFKIDGDVSFNSDGTSLISFDREKVTVWPIAELVTRAKPEKK